MACPVLVGDHRPCAGTAAVDANDDPAHAADLRLRALRIDGRRVGEDDSTPAASVIDVPISTYQGHVMRPSGVSIPARRDQGGDLPREDNERHAENADRHARDGVALVCAAPP